MSDSKHLDELLKSFYLLDMDIYTNGINMVIQKLNNCKIT